MLRRWTAWHPEQVLVSHGEPVLEGGREALAWLLRG